MTADDVAQRVGELAVRLWEEATDEDEHVEASAVSEAVRALSRVGAEPPTAAMNALCESMREATAYAVEADADIAPHRSRIRQIQEFAEAGLVPHVLAADVTLGALVLTLQHELVLAKGTWAIPNYVRTESKWALTHGSDEQVSLALQAARAAIWFNESHVTTMEMYAASRKGDKFQPVTDVRLGEVVSRFSYSMDDAITIWLESFATPTSDVWHVYKSRAARKHKPEWRTALMKQFAELVDEPYERLFNRILRDAHEVGVHDSFFELLSVERRSLEANVKAILKLKRTAKSNQDRQRVFALWRACKITDGSAAEQLGKGVLLPIATANKGAFDLALKNADLVVSHVPEFAGRLIGASPDSARTASAKRKLAPATSVPGRGGDEA